MKILTIILIGISLSMDAFSLAILYGSKNIKEKDIKKLSLSVGMFHFFMPILGCILGNIIFNIFEIDTDIVIFLILSIIGINMILDSRRKKEVKNIYNIEIIAFSLAVSIDSFSIGIGLNAITNNLFIPSIVLLVNNF